MNLVNGLIELDEAVDVPYFLDMANDDVPLPPPLERTPQRMAAFLSAAIALQDDSHAVGRINLTCLRDYERELAELLGSSAGSVPPHIH